MQFQTPSSACTRHLHIHGHVQGVFYRASMVREAERLGLQGWVRNRREGTVEALATGSPDAVAALIAWAHRGPEQARVTRVDVHDADAPAEAQAGFVQHETAESTARSGGGA